MDILNELKEMASQINEDTKNVRLEASKLVKDFEEVFNFPPSHLTIDDMDQRYSKKGQMYYLNDFQSPEGYKQIVATGATSIDSAIKMRLKTLEYLYPRISESYMKFPRVDEVWYLDIQSVAAGNTRKNIMFLTEPGFDLGGEYERGEKPYSRFGIIGPGQNPDRNSLWSPDAFIEHFDEFVISAQKPVYVNNEFVGKISLHYNLFDLRENTVAKSNSHLLIISSQNTIIGMSKSAKVITQFPEYEKKPWDLKSEKTKYVNNELNLVKRNKEFSDKISSLTPGNFVEFVFSGKEYKVYKEIIPEIGFQLLLLL